MEIYPVLNFNMELMAQPMLPVRPCVTDACLSLAFGAALFPYRVTGGVSSAPPCTLAIIQYHAKKRKSRFL